MDIRRISEDYSVTGQISPDDLPTLKAEGFRSIVCHRPDNEQAGQPSFEAVKQAAAEQGIEMRHIPIGQMGVTEEAVRQMIDALDEMERPMLGYCRSGARSTAVFQQTAHLRS